jgi:hypothetical protein
VKGRVESYPQRSNLVSTHNPHIKYSSPFRTT